MPELRRQSEALLRTSRQASPVPIDFSHLQQYTAGDAALEAEILGLFADTARATLQKLQTAESDKEWREAVHKLKGSALAVGAWTLADVATRVEHAELTGEARAVYLLQLASAVEAAASRAQQVVTLDPSV